MKKGQKKLGIHKIGASGPKTAPSLCCRGHHCLEVRHIDMNPVPRDDGRIGLYPDYHRVKDCSVACGEALRHEPAMNEGKITSRKPIANLISVVKRAVEGIQIRVPTKSIIPLSSLTKSLERDCRTIY